MIFPKKKKYSIDRQTLALLYGFVMSTSNTRGERVNKGNRSVKVLSQPRENVAASDAVNTFDIDEFAAIAQKTSLLENVRMHIWCKCLVATMT